MIEYGILLVLLFITLNLISSDKQTFEIISKTDIIKSKGIFVYNKEEETWKSIQKNKNLHILIFSVDKRRMDITFYDESGGGVVIPLKEFLEIDAKENWEEIKEINIKKINDQEQSPLKITKNEDEILLNQEKGAFSEYGEIKIKF